jgi:hypothetical protein
MNMMTNKTFPNALLVSAGLGCALMLGACGGGGGGGGGDGNPIPLNQPDALMDGLNDKIASTSGSISFVQGQAPAQTGDGLTPKVTAGIEVTAEPGDTISLPVSIGGAPDLSALFAKVPGAASYFEVDLGGAGKAGSKSAERLAKQGGGFALNTIIGFNVTLPSNLSTGGEFCFEFAARDAGGNVSSRDESCVTVVVEKPTPTDDQPGSGATATALQGTWNSPCFDSTDDFDGDGTIEPDEQESVREIINFVGTNQYSTFFDFHTNRTCAGTAERLQAPGGTYALGAASQADSQGKYARAIDFVPDPNDPNFGGQVATCYNLLRLEGTGGSFNTLLLGYPIPFSFNFEDIPGAPEPVSGDCRTQQTRPTSVITSLPFGRG